MWITPADIVSRWTPNLGEAPSATDPRLVTLIDDVELEIRRVLPGIGAYAASDPDVLARIKSVGARACIRLWQYAGQYQTSYSEQMGPYGMGGSSPARELNALLLDSEIEAMRPTAARRAGMISMGTGSSRPLYGCPGPLSTPGDYL